MSNKTNRRDLLLLGAVLTGVAAGWQVWLALPRPLEFVQIANLPGWRRITFDNVTGTGGSAGDAVFVGIGATEDLTPLPVDALCTTLYASQTKGIPSAIFTDVNCPNCARLEAKLKVRSDMLSLNWLDLPILGPTSENAARALVAGDLQTNDPAFRTAVVNTAPGRLRPTVLRSLAHSAGLDADRLLSDMDGPKVEATLLKTRRAAETLGVWGTPGFTIGRTLVLGDMREDVLDQLIREEADAKTC